MNYCLLLLLACFVNSKYILSIVFSTSGARYPTYEKFDWIKGRGHRLSAAGMRQHYLLGQIFRKRYIEDSNFLSPTYNSSEIKVMGTSSERTQASAQAQMMGLFTPGTGKTINDEDVQRAHPPNEYDYSDWIDELGESAIAYRYSDIPIESRLDMLLIPTDICPGINKLVEYYRKEHIDERNKKNEEYKIYYKSIVNALNISNSDITMETAYQLRDVVRSSIYEGFSHLKEEVVDEILQKSEDIDRYLRLTSYLMVTYDERAVYKIISSSFLTEVKNLIQTKINSIKNKKETPEKLLVYVGSGITLDSTLIPFKFDTELIFSLYCSALVIELIEINDKYQVKVTFDNSAYKDYTLDEFIDFIEKSVYDPKTTKEYCENFAPKPEPESNLIIIAYISIAIIVTGITAVILMLIAHCVKIRRARKINPSVNMLFEESKEIE